MCSVPATVDPSHGTRLVRWRLDSRLTPQEALLWLRDDDRPFALVGEWAGARALLGSAPTRVATGVGDPFAVLDQLPDVAAGEVRVGCAWVGWLGYRLGERVEVLPPGPPAPVSTSGFSLAFYDHLLLWDGVDWWFEALWTPEREPILQARLALWRRRLGQAPPRREPAAIGPFALGANGAAGHLAAVARCRELIAAGDLFQANLCVRLQTGFAGDRFELFSRALSAAQPRFGALLDGVLSLSPERFLRRDGRRVWTEPIKGTAPRRGAATAQEASLAALTASDKDAAEHVMIVDLMRNDLGRVCAYGSIAAEAPRAEPHAGVWHLVSTVSGQLRADVSDSDLLRATFPPGSVTGAPKVQAMKVIAELEATRREAYTGAIGLVSPVAGLDLSVAIRTFEIAGEQIWLGAGGGIVADSDPQAELQEALTKAAGPLSAIGAGIAPVCTTVKGLAPRLTRALDYGQRPDPAAGLLETILVRDGKATLAHAHLQRLARSMLELYGIEPADDLAARVAQAAAGASTARLRVVVAADGTVQIGMTPVTAPVAMLELVPFALPGGLGAHKWHDRTLLDALAALQPGAVPLLVDTDGDVLEAAHANVWIDAGGALLTPPADGRLLPGVTRAAVLASRPAASEQRLTLDQLRQASTVYLSSAISGWRSARLREQ